MNLPLLASSTFVTWPPFWFFLGYSANLKQVPPQVP